MKKKYRKLLCEGIPLLLWCACTLISEELPASFSLFLAILLHEAGHLLALLLLGMNWPKLAVGPLGFRLLPERPLFFWEQGLVAFAGPLVNLLSALLLTWLFGFTTPAQLHLLTALANLLPIDTLDGGRIVEALLSMCCSPEHTYVIVRALSFLTVTLATMISLGLLWTRGQGSYLFFLFFSLFLLHIFRHTGSQPRNSSPFL